MRVFHFNLHMQVSRLVNVAVKDKSIQWNKFSKVVFSDFVFQIPSIFQGLTFNEPGAKVRLEFVKDDGQLDVYIENGSDPFLRPFLFLYWLQVPANEELPKPVIENILRWVARVLMINMNFCVIIVQEEVSFFGSPKTIDRSALIPDAKYDSNLIIIPAKKQMKLSDLHVEMIRAKVRNLLIDSFEIYELEARNLIKNSEASSSHIFRRKVWRSFLIYYYGFLDYALSGFLENYNVLIKQLKDPLTEAIPPIDPNWITTYPLTRDNNYSTVLMFALGGAMAVYYSKVEFIEIFRLFMRQWAHMNECCTTLEQEDFVNLWAMQSLEGILSISDITANESINTMLLMQRYLLAIKMNSSMVPEFYSQLSKITQGRPKMSAVVTSHYLQWAVKNGKELPKICDETLMWDFGFNDALLHYQRACEADDQEGIIASAKVLLNSQASDESKSDIVKKMSGFNRSIIIEEPVQAKFELTPVECQVFKNSDIKLNVYIPHWMTLCQESIEITYVSGENSIRARCTRGSNDCISCVVSFKTPGDWRLDKICFIYNNLTFVWKDLSYLSIISVSPPSIPDVQLDFPSLTGLKMTMSFILQFDLIEYVDVDFEASISVENEQVSLIETKYESCFYNNGYLQFDKCPCGHLVQSKIDFQLKDMIESTYMVINMKLGGIDFEKRFKLSFAFPIEFECRNMTEDFAHIRLKNNADSPLTIERAELGTSNWNSIELQPLEETYLLAELKGVTTPTLTVFVKDQRGLSIAQSWEVKVCAIPTLRARFVGAFSYGRESKIHLNLPKGTIEILGNPSLFVTGKVFWPDFEGGDFVFGVVPVIFGDIRMPEIKINDIGYILDVTTVSVPKPTTSVCIPLVTSDCP